MDTKLLEKKWPKLEVRNRTNEQKHVQYMDADGDGRRKRLMRSLDAINGRFGRDTIIFGAQGMGDAPWHMRQEHRSPRMTTCWDELPLARC